MVTHSKICDKAIEMRKYRAELRSFAYKLPHKVTLDQYSILHVLNIDPVQSQKSICVLTHIDRSTMADVLKRLHERGWIVIKGDDADRRKQNVALTKLGRSVLNACYKLEEKMKV